MNTYKSQLINRPKAINYQKKNFLVFILKQKIQKIDYYFYDFCLFIGHSYFYFRVKIKLASFARHDMKSRTSKITIVFLNILNKKQISFFKNIIV